MPKMTDVMLGVVVAFEKAGIAPDETKRYLLDVIPVDVVGEREQLVFFNSHLRRTLGRLRVNTLEARGCLVDSMSIDDWTYCLGKYIAPLMKRYEFGR